MFVIKCSVGCGTCRLVNFILYVMADSCNNETEKNISNRMQTAIDIKHIFCFAVQVMLNYIKHIFCFAVHVMLNYTTQIDDFMH